MTRQTFGCPAGFLSIFSVLVFSLVFGLATCSLHGQDANQSARSNQKPYPIKGMVKINPKIFKLDIPNGELRLPLDGECVMTKDEAGKRVVAKVHTGVGENYVVMLPNGSLVGRMGSDVEATDEKFKAATHAEIAAEIIRENDFKGFKFEETEHFVLVYNCSPQFARVTARVMETMLDGVMKFAERQGITVHEPEVPLPVIAFHTDRDFQTFKPIPPGVAAYYEISSNRVVLKEESALSRMGRPDLAEAESLSTIAHEGCHQLLHNIGVQQRLSRWPLWLGEGIAEYMAPTEVKSKRSLAWKGAGQINDLRMFEFETFMQKQYVKGFDGDTIDGTVRAGNLDSTGYSAAWTLTHYLANERKADFDRYMRYLSRMAPLTGMVPDVINDEVQKQYTKETFPKVEDSLTHFKAFFGEDIAEIENELVQFLIKSTRRTYQSPVADYAHVVALAVVPGLEKDQKFACFFLQEADVAEWATELKETLSEYEQEHCDIRTAVFPNRASANQAIDAFIKDKKKRNRR